MRGSRAFKVALGAWLVCTFLLWNLVFDLGVKSAENRYLAAQSQSGARAPADGIRAVMDPAIRRSAITATVCAGGMLAGGLALLLVFSRRKRHAPPVRDVRL